MPARKRATATDSLFDDDHLCPHCGQPMPQQASLIAKPNPIRECLGVFNGKFREKFGENAPLTPGKDGAAMKRLLAQYDIERVKQLIEAFFASDDRFITESNYSVGVFASQVGKLIAAENGRARAFGNTRNTSQNVQVAQRFVERRQR